MINNPSGIIPTLKKQPNRVYHRHTFVCKVTKNSPIKLSYLKQILSHM